MREDVREAVEAACQPLESRPSYRPAVPVLRQSFNGIRAIVLSVVRELPEDMTLAELRDELED